MLLEKVKKILVNTGLFAIILQLLPFGMGNELQWTVSITPLTGISYDLDFGLIFSNPKVLECALLVESDSLGVLYSKTCLELFPNIIDDIADGCLEKYIEIWNYESSTASLTISIGNYLTQELQTFYESSTHKFSNAVKSSTVKNAQKLPNNYLQAAMIFKEDVIEYMLPFNLISEKQPKILIDENVEQLSQITYQNEPFLETYWNQIERDQLIITWLPYFSNCQYKTNHRIFFADLIDPRSDGLNRCREEYSLLWGANLHCDAKQIIAKCSLQQLSVNSSSKSAWWQNSFNPPYYFFRRLLLKENYLQNMDDGDYIESISESYYKEMIPLIYKIDFNYKQVAPNHFTFVFDVKDHEKPSEYKLLKVTLLGERREDLQVDGEIIEENMAKLMIKVNYVDAFGYISSLQANSFLYIAMFLSIVILTITIVLFGLEKKEININYRQVKKLTVYPVVKGFILAFFPSIIFVSLFYMLSHFTNFQLISVTFNGSELQDINPYYAGRSGLSLLLAGYFLLMTGIGYTFKVLDPEEAHIYIEYDQEQKQSSLNSFTSEAISEEKQSFLIKNMNSHRRYLFLYLVCFPGILLFIYYMCVERMAQELIYINVLLYPLAQEAILKIYRHYVIKDMLFLFAILVSLQAYFDFFFINDLSFGEVWAVYLSKIFAENIALFSLQKLSEKLAFKANDYMQKKQEINQVTLPYRFLLLFRTNIKDVISESKYEKSLFFACLLIARLLVCLTRPFIVSLSFLTIKYNLICRDVRTTEDQLFNHFLFVFCSIPLEVLVMLLGIKFCDAKMGLCVKKCIEFSHHNFRSRNQKWVSDIFEHNRCVQDFYRELDKFCFSSQMYHLIFLVVYAIFAIFFGAKIILQAKYIPYVDPALLIIFSIVWVCGYFSSALLSFISIKFKFYSTKKEIKMKTKLETVQKILRKTDYTEYLQLQAVKNYFLFHCKDWIIKNLTRILDKEDFQENNFELLTKYKHYKNLLKKRQIEARKNMIKEHESEEQNFEASKKILSHQKKTVIKIPKKQFNQFAKPLLYSWLYTAKQFTYLRGLISTLKLQYKKETCEYCSMSIELEVLQKNDFIEIVNQYRITNVGRIFDAQHFIEFYQCRQKYVTVCIQCMERKTYLQKNSIDLPIESLKLMYKWLIKARSRLLHRQKSRLEGDDLDHNHNQTQFMYNQQTAHDE